MSLRKEEKSSPSPLPMPQQVLLKHVPTFVRRTYDSQLDKLIQDLPLNDGKSEGDEDEDVGLTSTTNDVGDSFNEKTKDGVFSNDATIGKYDIDHNPWTCTKDFGPNASLHVDKCESEVDGLKDVNVSGYCTNDSDEDEKIKDKEYGNFDDKQGLLVEDNESHKEEDSYRDAIVNMDVQDEGLETEPENSLTTMTFGKNANKKGYHSPCPLPMYQRVTLKHAPTMVRRRYDKDLHKFDASKELPWKDSKIEDFEGEYVVPPSIVSHVGDMVNDKAKDGTQSEGATIVKCDINQDTQTCIEDFGPSASMFLEDGKSEDDGPQRPQDVNLTNPLECIDEIRNQNNDDAQGLQLEDNEREEDSYGDAIVNMNFQNEGLETEPENSPTIMTFKKNVNKKGYHSPRPLPMYERVTLKHVPTIVRRKYDKDLLKFDASKGCAFDDGSESKGDRALYANPTSTLSEVDDSTSHESEDVTITKHDAQTCTDEFLDMYSEDGKSEGDADEESDLSSSTNDNPKDILEVNGVEKSDSEKDSCSKDCTIEEDEAKDVNFTYSVYGRIEDEVLDRELDLESSYVGDSVEDEVQGKIHGSSHNDYGSHIEHCKSEGDGIDVATYYMDDCIKYEAQDTKCLNLDNKNGFPIQDLKSKGNSARDEHHETANHGMKDHDTGLEDSYCGHDMVDSVHCEDSDFDPEAFKKTLARDGYDLCCPNCKRCITETVIIRRKEKGQQYETTCFSWLIALFRCIQW